jgi:DHA1 family arabinose polymer transporter-like MFS transporter
MVGGGMLNLSGMNYHFTALGGVPLAVIAVALLTIYSMRHETHTDALERMREITV